MTSNITKNFRNKSALRTEPSVGRVYGPGGPTDDAAGNMPLSNGEVVLPTDTAQAVGYDKLENLIAATHTPVEGAKGMANGGTFFTDSNGNTSTGSGGPYPMVRYPPRPPATTLPEPKFMGNAEVVQPAGRFATGLRTAGRVLDKVAGPVAMGYGAYDAAREGLNTKNVGDMISGGLTMIPNPVTKAGAAGWGTGRLIGGSLPERVNEGIGGVVNQMANYVGLGTSPDAYNTVRAMEAEDQRKRMAAPPEAGALRAPAGFKTGGLGGTATPGVASDQLPANLVQPGSTQSRALSEAGVTAPAQNEAPLLNSSATSAAGVMQKNGTSKYQNIGSFGGDANIYGKADDPTKPTRMNNFSGVGTGTSAGGAAASVPAALNAGLRTVSAEVPGGARVGISGDGSGAEGINSRYDNILRGGTGRNVVNGLDWSARHGAAVEQNRGRELTAAESNAATLRGQDMTAAVAGAKDQNARDIAELQARTALATAGLHADATRSATAASNARDMYKMMYEAQKEAQNRGDKAAGQTHDDIASVADIRSAGDAATKAKYFKGLSTLPATTLSGISGAPQDVRQGVLNGGIDLLDATQPSNVAGRSVAAMGQNAALGSVVGSQVPVVGRTLGTALDLAARGLTRGRYTGNVASSVLGSRLGSATLGGVTGMVLTPENKPSGRIPIPVTDADGNPVPAKLTVPEMFKYGAGTGRFGSEVYRDRNGAPVILPDGFTPDALRAVQEMNALEQRKSPLRGGNNN